MRKNLCRQEDSSYPSCISVNSLFLYLPLSLSAIISPPPFSSSGRVHPPPLLQSNPTAINQALFSSRGRSYQRPPSSLSSVSSIQLSLHLYLCSCDILSFSLSTFVFFSVLQSLISISLLHFKEIVYGPARRKPTLKCITLKREHEVNNLY